MSRPVEKTIDGFKVSTTRHATMRGLQLRARLLKIVLPAVSALSASGVKSIGAMADTDTAELDVEKMAPALERLAQAIPPAELPDLVCELLINTSIVCPVGDKIIRIELANSTNIDMAFDDKDELLFYKVIAHAIGVNFGSFFAALAQAGAKAKAETLEPSP